MPQVIEVPELGLLEFPDGMTDAEIASAIDEEYARQKPPEEPGFFSRAFGSLKEAYFPEQQPIKSAGQEIAISPYEAAQMESFGSGRGKPDTGMERTTEFVEAIGQDPVGFAMSPLTIAGDVLNAAASDVGATIGTTLAGQPQLAGQQGGNIYEYFNRDRVGRLPQEQVLADISKEHPALATTGKVASGVVKSAPMIAMIPQGAIGKLIAGGFTVDMISHAGEAATRLGEEMGKPESERDADKLTTALSDIIQTTAFAPLAGKHASKLLTKKGIRELAESIKTEPLESEVKNATETRIEPQGNIIEREGIDAQRQAAEASRSDSPIRSAEGEVVPTVEPSPEIITSLKPKEPAASEANVASPVGEAAPTAAEGAIRVEGAEQKMRKSAARATTAESVPEPVQERIAEAPESRYKVQPQSDVRDVIGAMSDIELSAVPKESNIHVASKLELSKRLFDQGKNEEGYNVFQEVSKTGTDLGQNINQFKMLKGASPFHVVELVNQGLTKAGKDPLTKAQAEVVGQIANKSIEANKQLDAAKNEWQKNPTDENAKRADEALEMANQADLETQQKINQYSPKSWPRMLKAFAQGNPLTPISQVANVVGNVMGAGMEAGSRGVGSFIDTVRTMYAGGKRELAASPISGPVAALSGGAKALKQSGEILMRGSGDVVKGEFRQNLRPLRALATAFAKNPDVPTEGGKVPFGERARLAVEGTFGITPEIMLRLLSAADKPSYEAARARLINEQSKLSKLPQEHRGMAQKFPELFFDRDTLRRIQSESENAVFQNKSVGISYLESWIKQHGGDWADLAFTMLVAPYRLTPWNLVGRTLIYNPLIAAVRTGYYANKGNVRQAELNAGRLMVGSLLYGAGYFMYANGLIGPSLDSRDETKKERLLAGEVLPPNHVNLSGLKRLKNGDDPTYRPGDETWDLTRGGGAAGAILSSVANIGRDFEKKPEGNNDLLVSLLRNSTLEQASFTINQSFLKGVTGILDAVRDRNIEPYMRSVESMFMNLGTPNTLTALSRATRKYAPDLKGGSAKKDLENLARERFGTTGLDDYLPLKRDLWGKPMLQTPEGRNSIIYHLFDISKNKQVTSDPVTLEIYDLWRTTANREVIPSIPERELTRFNKTIPLNPKQYERLVELVGTKRREIMDALVVNPEFQNLTKEGKIKVIERAYRNGLRAGKNLFVHETPPQELAEPKKPKAGFAQSE